MVAPDDDRRGDVAAPHQLVECEAEPGAIAVAKPENSRGQPLKGDSLGRHPNPAAQRVVMLEHVERETVRRGDVRGVA